MKNEGLEMLDVLNILSFCISLMNYGENLTQGDKQDLMQEFDSSISNLLEDIHNHLTEQDKKLDRILNMIELNLKELEGLK